MPLNLEQAWGYVEEWMSSPNCTVVSESNYHPQTLMDCLSDVPRLTGNVLQDFHNAVLMREHGIPEILTLDQDFRTFPWITIRPLPEPDPS